MNLGEMHESILIGVFGKEGGNSKNYEAVKAAGIDDFSKPSYDFLWQYQNKYYAKTKEIISWPILKTVITDSKRLTPDVKLLYLSEVKKLFKNSEYRRVVNNKLIKFSLSELSTIKRHTQFADIVHEHFVGVNTGDVDDLNDALNKTLAQLTSKLVYRSQSEDYTITDYGKSFEERQKQRKQEKEQPDTYKKFRFAYEGLKAVFPRGVRGGEVCLVSGISGIGKSITALDLAKCGAFQGLNVAIVISENSMFQTCGRLDANITGIEYDLIQGYGFNDKELKEFEKAFNKKMEALKNINIKIIKVSPNNFTVLTVNRALNELKTKEGYVPDMVIIDSPDLMHPSVDVRYIGDHAARLQSTAVHWEIKSFAIDQDYVIFCTTQLTRQAAKKGGDVSSEDVAEDYNKIRICDIFLILYETLDLALQNQMGVKIGKNRDGAKPPEGIILLVDKARMSFYNLDGTPGDFERVDIVKLLKKKSGLIPKKSAIVSIKKNHGLIPKKSAVMAQMTV
jgi:replicative DNA helicase